MNEKTEQRLTIAWKAAGWCLVAASCAFIAIKAARTPMGGLAGAVTMGTAALVLLFSIIYSLLNVLLAFAWALLYRMASRGGPSVSFMAGVHLRTGIVKYLPGNVFHLAGRHVLAGKAGAGQGPVLAANVLEMGTIVIAALAVVAATAGPVYLDHALAFLRGRLDAAGTVILVLPAAAAVALGVYLAWKYRRLLEQVFISYNAGSVFRLPRVLRRGGDAAPWPDRAGGPAGRKREQGAWRCWAFSASPGSRVSWCPAPRADWGSGNR